MSKKTIIMKCPGCNATDFFWDEKINIYRCNYCGDTFIVDIDKNETLLSTLRICSKCGTENNLESRFCKKCGHLLRINCPKCGRLIDADAVFCSDCKVNIKDEIERRKKEELEIFHDNLVSQIAANSLAIESTNKEIEELNEKMDGYQSVAGKLYFWGKGLLVDEEKTMFEQLSSDIGCVFRIIANVIGYGAAVLAFRLILSSIHAIFPPYDPDVSQTNALLGMTLVISFIFGHIATGVMYIFHRQYRVDEFTGPIPGQIESLENELKDLQSKKELYENQLADLENH